MGWVDSPSEVPEGPSPTDLYLRSREQGRGLSLAVPVFQEPMVPPHTFLLQSVSKETRGVGALQFAPGVQAGGCQGRQFEARGFII